MKKTINPAVIILPVLAAIITLAIYFHSTGFISMSN